MRPKVSRSEINRWLRQVARIDPRSPRAAYYVKYWNVRDKIAREKATYFFTAVKPSTGSSTAATGNCPRPPAVPRQSTVVYRETERNASSQQTSAHTMPANRPSENAAKTST